jgi:hypothetical protein
MLFLGSCREPVDLDEGQLEQEPLEIQPTPTPTLIPNPQSQTKVPVSLLTGTLEIRFPDPWGRPKFCASEISYELNLVDNAYELNGEGSFYCYQVMTYDLGIKHHLIQDYAVTLSGSKPIEPEAILDLNLVFDGQQENYFSDMPPNVPEIVSEMNPFQVAIDNQPLVMRFRYEDGAYCLWNSNGLFTSLPGDEPPLGEDGWLFILHPAP